jgi:hypothetical protein
MTYKTTSVFERVYKILGRNKNFIHPNWDPLRLDCLNLKEI